MLCWSGAAAPPSPILPSATAPGMDAHRSRAGTASGLMGLAQFGLAGALAPVVSLGGATRELMASAMVVAAAMALLIALLTRRGDQTRPTVDPVVPAPGVLAAAVDRTRQ